MSPEVEEPAWREDETPPDDFEEMRVEEAEAECMEELDRVFERMMGNE